MNTIVINGNAEDILSTKLSEILDCFNISNNFICQLIHLEAVSKDESFDQLAFEEKIASTDGGIIYSFDEMKEIEKNIHQIIEIYLNVLDKAFLKIGEISLVDGSYYLVVVPDENIAENLLKLDGAYFE